MVNHLLSALPLIQHTQFQFVVLLVFPTASSSSQSVVRGKGRMRHKRDVAPVKLCFFGSDSRTATSIPSFAFVLASIVSVLRRTVISD